MAYRLSFVEDPSVSVRRAAQEQLEDAAELLEHGLAKDPVGAVHEARKDLKKSRALLRLARPGMEKRAYRLENRALRDTGRTVSAMRDADAMEEAVAKLAERFAGQLPAGAFDDLRARLDERASAQRGAVDSATLEGVVGALRGAALRSESWPLEECDWKAVGVGIARAYADGRRAFACAEHAPSALNLHEWRKRVKDLWYHSRLLQPAWPGPLDAQADEAHTLSELLGDNHDLAVLVELVEDVGVEVAGDARLDPATLVELVEARRGELRDEGFRLGRRLYAEPPKAFRRRVGRYLRAASQESELAVGA